MNNLNLLEEILSILRTSNIKVWIFGGWTEELLGISKSHIHKDIDLFYPAKTFEPLEKFIEKNQLQEIQEKKLPHKRAFIFKGVLVEVFLIQNDSKGYYTNFWGTKKHYWPDDIFSNSNGVFNMVSMSTLDSYRKNYAMLRKSVD